MKIQVYTIWRLKFKMWVNPSTCIPEEQDLQLENEQQIEHWKKHDYLSVQITNNGTLFEAVKCINTRCRKTISKLDNILWH